MFRALPYNVLAISLCSTSMKIEREFAFILHTIFGDNLFVMKIKALKSKWLCGKNFDEENKYAKCLLYLKT